MSDINAALQSVQINLQVGKERKNEFGGFNYRSAEDILNAVKPLLDEIDASLTLSDDIRLIGDRYYIEAIATFSIGAQKITAHGFAREAAEKKGMDSAQLTGSCSSYARKYALNGLFAIDDGRDADEDNSKASERQIAMFETLMDARDGLGLWLFRRRVGDKVYTDIYNSFPAGQKVEKKKLCADLEKQGREQVSNIETALQESDPLMLAENLDGITEATHRVLSTVFEHDQMGAINDAHKANQSTE